MQKSIFLIFVAFLTSLERRQAIASESALVQYVEISAEQRNRCLGFGKEGLKLIYLLTTLS